MPVATESHVVLVPGNFVGPGIWREVVDRLGVHGVSVTVVRLPSSTVVDGAPGGDLHDDAARVRAILDEMDGRVVLCGHSYGGAVITEAAAGPHPAVEHLVYVTGAMPDVGESLAALAPAAPADDTAGESVRFRADGMIELLPDSAREALFHDCDPRRREEAVAQLVPSNPVVGGQAVRGAAWREIPTTFVRGEVDRMPELVSASVHRPSLVEVHIDAGHCPNWTRAEQVTDVVLGRTPPHGP
ncbi:alpha/beta hydrolase [Spiractinospora alimapuensis]|uniref:alpha/beta fold hydrolase n=1 Tax=Spiractinospora alimapuensis TaxID=2820884 RepID=UPI001F3B6883|nr:alpha/beta hydrolase [Spiractinospora alimapuensis]QVQ52748.1 alpha/beta hydrolase [Spiractinospora alimapuensis]